MKKIFVFGDSNTWGYIPGSFNFTTLDVKRYPRSKRWIGVMHRLLNSDCDIIEDGLNGRTTIFNDQIMPGTNGKEALLPAILSHMPFDLVILMLGTNDTKAQFNVSAAEISSGLRQLISVVKNTKCGSNDGTPEILVISPIHIIDNCGPFAEQFVNGYKKSIELASHYQNICKAETINFLDAALFAKPSEIDAIHLDVLGHKQLGIAVANKVNEILF